MEKTRLISHEEVERVLRQAGIRPQQIEESCAGFRIHSTSANARRSSANSDSPAKT